MEETNTKDVKEENEQEEKDSETQMDMVQGKVSFSKSEDGHYFVNLEHDNNKIIMDAIQFLAIAQKLHQSIVRDQLVNKKIITPGGNTGGNIIVPK